MAERNTQVIAIATTTAIAFISGFMLGVYSIRGYLISPALAEERRRNIQDPEESEESDIDEADTILDHAPNWANGAEADRRQGLKVQDGANITNAQRQKKPSPPAADIVDKNEECKLVLVVRTDLGMTKGKIAAQCGHATLACYKSLTKAAQKKGDSSPEARLLARWERHGQAKIAVQTKSQDEILELMGKARSLGVTAEVIADAGRTQIDAGSLTVLGVGPAPKSLVDQVTGQLKLL
ncbi:uncharacterized protein E0L32_009279 [Thyridium curvatum]|uniref:peptidyl-tRNA hydrolase n=1 Tax=Thyridium curvatum TaxID=1093900 RepID=A0A507AS60_9PEZI|nr:uncharacterized protein E0L32_009279 [Thyridium curvatum]TPX09536.1 hypothetical protein E0L32_009279 [Thyridium curvatum]